MLGRLPDGVTMLAAEDRVVVVVATGEPSDGVPGSDVLYRVTAKGPVPLVGAGDVTPAGTIVRFAGIAVARDEVLFAAELADGAVRRALFAVAPDR